MLTLSPSYCLLNNLLVISLWRRAGFVKKEKDRGQKTDLVGFCPLSFCLLLWSDGEVGAVAGLDGELFVDDRPRRRGINGDAVAAGRQTVGHILVGADLDGVIVVITREGEGQFGAELILQQETAQFRWEWIIAGLSRWCCRGGRWCAGRLFLDRGRGGSSGRGGGRWRRRGDGWGSGGQSWDLRRGDLITTGIAAHILRAAGHPGYPELGVGDLKPLTIVGLPGDWVLFALGGCP